ncbi:hypothetical protein PIB30_066192 [Stylosanthes scabra]|uniref:RNase H type-1 domain-containing protein n=1 Tax=Stylosanthes scabra TaxID=79078 RepID=A0ABU6SM84_9FABA|nr:hypothetical protein [Stylosanthes scabra]
MRCEIFALWRGLVLSWEYGIKRVVCETNSKDAFLTVQSGNQLVAHDDVDLIEKIRDLCNRDWQVHFNLVLREANAVVDFMAKRGAIEDEEYVEWIHPWSDLQALVLRDSSELGL